MSPILRKFMPFWLFLGFFKFAGALHYTLLSPFGEQLLPLWIVGLLIGGESLIQATLDLPAGYLLDKLGYRRMLAVSTLAFIATGACFILGLTLGTYILTIFFSIFGWLFFVPGMNAYLLSHATESESERFFSIKDVSNAVGVVCASVALPFVLLFDPQSAGVVLVGLQAIALACLIASPKDKVLPPRHEQTLIQRRHIRRHSLRTLWRTMKRLNPASGMLVLLTLSAAMFYAMIWFIVPLVIAAQQGQAGVLGFGLAIFDFSIVVLGYLLGSWANKNNRRTFVFFGLLIFSICGMALGFSFGLLFILFGFLTTTGDEMANIALWSWLHHLDHDHDHDGAISGVITLADDIGYAIGPVLAGVLYSTLGPGLSITLGAMPIFILWVLYYMLVHKHFPIEDILALAPARLQKWRHKS
jgi:MFS family permease